MTRNDFLNPLFSSHPILVAFVTWLTGWGTLLLLVWKTDSLSEFFRSPKFMIGDFLLLPASAFLIGSFYHSVEKPTASAMSGKVTYTTLVLATLATVLATVYSIFVSKNYSAIWSVPHTVFIWYIAYILIGFFIRGVLQLPVHSTPLLWRHHLGVVLAMLGHAVLGFIWG